MMQHHMPSIHTLKCAQRLIQATQLDLSDLVVYTEAATGGYAVTAGLAAMSGSKRVFALARDSHCGTAAEAAEATLHFARMAGVEERIEIVEEKRNRDLMLADIVTNSGHVRPIDRQTIETLKVTVAIPLMYEAWEYRPEDLDLRACRDRGIPVAGTDEAHPAVGILSYLGLMAVKLLLDGGVEVAGTRMAVWSDNKFCRYVVPALVRNGAEVLLSCPDRIWQSLTRQTVGVQRVGDLAQLPRQMGAFEGVDAVVLVMSPSDAIWVGESGKSVVASAELARVASGAAIAQFWGSVDRRALSMAGLRSLPLKTPDPQHMGILPSDLGLVPMLRLQTGGLKVGEFMARARLGGADHKDAEQLAVNQGYGQLLAEDRNP